MLKPLLGNGPWQIKFVIDSRADLAEAEGWLEDLGVRADDGAVFMMPQGITADDLARTTAWLSAACDRLGYRLAPRHHIEWFGHRRAT